MPQAVDQEAPPPTSGPLKKVASTKPLRVKEHIEDEVNRGRLKLSAELGYEVDLYELFNDFVTQQWPGYVEELLSKARSSTKRKDRK